MHSVSTVDEALGSVYTHSTVQPNTTPHLYAMMFFASRFCGFCRIFLFTLRAWLLNMLPLSLAMLDSLQGIFLAVSFSSSIRLSSAVGLGTFGITSSLFALMEGSLSKITKN